LRRRKGRIRILRNPIALHGYSIGPAAVSIFSSEEKKLSLLVVLTRTSQTSGQKNKKGDELASLTKGKGDVDEPMKWYGEAELL
jgi:hypothetical protein